ncbi:MAG: hypothetical protein ABDH63_00650 [Candidatus Caldarchaeales archaeon]
MRAGKYVALLSGDHPELGLGELRAVLEVLGVKGEPELLCERLASFEAPEETARKAATRCAFVKEVIGLAVAVGPELIGSSVEVDPSALEGIGEPYAVRAVKLGGAEGPSRVEIERWAASAVERARPGLRVDLKSPRTVFRVYVTERLVTGGPVVGIRDGSGLSRRAPVNRPFRLPSTLQPKEARVMVNLTRTPPGSRLLDPFSGTGAILMEAASLSYDAVGIEVRTWIARGSLRNLKAFGLSGGSDVIAGDSTSLPLRGGVGGVATDPPYGKSTRVIGPSLADLVDRVLSELAELLEKGRRIVVAYPLGRRAPAILEGPMVVERYTYRVHSSLIRTINVLRV